jgi:predicted dehydrogenase
MGEPDRVFATKAMQIDTKISGDDSVQVLCSSNAGWQAHMLFSWITLRGALPDIVVGGETGTFHLWPGTSYLDYYPANPTLVTGLLSYVRPYWLQEKLMRPRFSRVRSYLPDREPSGYLGEMREFLAAISEERELASPAEDARRDLEIVLRCYDALESDRWVTVPQVDWQRNTAGHL